MHPVLFKVGWFSVYSFGFMLAVSFLVGIYLSAHRAKRLGVNPQHILDLSVYIIISGVVGSRLLYVAFHLHEYENPIDVFALWQGGATLYGGFLLAVVAGYVFSKRRKIGFFLLGDIIAPAIALGVMLTRVGCFLSGCCYGAQTSCPLGVVFPPDSPAGAYARRLAAEQGAEIVHLHPSQLYDSFLGLVTVVLLLSLRGKLVKRGATFGLLLLCYGAFRFGVDFFRFYEENMRLGDHFNLNQVVSAVFVVVGILLLTRKTREKTQFQTKPSRT
jgi:phosphatidylglycerol:prolipoprotein diacylglycerol transferase